MPLLAKVVAEFASKDPSYRRELKRFVKFVDAHEQLGATAVGCYGTPTNVESFFNADVRLRTTVNPSGASRVVPALQALVSAENSPDYKDFTLRTNAAVCRALKLHKTAWKAKSKDRTTQKDPHANLSINVPSPEDTDELMRLCAEAGNTQLAVAYLAGTTVFARGQSERAWLLTHLGVVASLFGPPNPFDPRRRDPMLFFCLPEGVDKGAAAQTSVTGCWRHMEINVCLTGWVAAHLFKVLVVDQTVLEFTVGSQDGAKLRPLLDWEDTESGARAHSAAFTKIFKKMEVKFAKVTHGRTFGIVRASASGASAEAVAALSKHLLDKLNKAYMSDLQPQGMHIMAGGFGDWRTHVNRRPLIPFEGKPEELLYSIFPSYPTWVAQYEGPNGDRCPSNKEFLLNVLPYLATVLWQDAVALRCTTKFADDFRVGWMRKIFKDFDARAARAMQTMHATVATLAPVASASAALPAQYLTSMSQEQRSMGQEQRAQRVCSDTAPPPPTHTHTRRAHARAHTHTHTHTHNPSSKHICIWISKRRLVVQNTHTGQRTFSE